MCDVGLQEQSLNLTTDLMRFRERKCWLAERNFVIVSVLRILRLFSFGSFNVENCGHVCICAKE